jgi:hypothetical protein
MQMLINKQKIIWLGSKWTPASKPRRDKSQEGIIDTLKFLKNFIEELKQRYINDDLNGNQRLAIIDIMKRDIRRAHDIIKRWRGEHYQEIPLGGDRHFEHVIPLDKLASAYIQGHIDFEFLLNVPTCDLNDLSNDALTRKKLHRTNTDWYYFFRRYLHAEIENIQTPSGEKINLMDWTIEDHFRLYPPIKL